MRKLVISTFAVVLAAGMYFGLGAESAWAQNKVFISIGTGGPTGVYFVVGNSVCRMVHKEAAEGRKSGRKPRYPLLGPVHGRLDLQYRSDQPGRA